MEILYLNIAEKAIWSGVAAVGFGILLNVPRKVIFPIFLLASLSGFVKFLCLEYELNIIVATFFASFLVGTFSLLFAYKINKPLMVFGIPSVIPMIPGFFAYKTILGMKMFILATKNISEKNIALNSIFTNGFTTLFVLFVITVGVTAPLLILGKDFARKIQD